ncbi:MAG: alanine racemase [Gammaproteobacteria bacterium]|nr:alanine racemase [Gammaproteobacteria bacterium]
MGPEALIDLAALRANLRRVKEKAPRSRVLAVIKANAYGHGAVRIARALEAADALALARVKEAVSLRRAGITKPLMVLEGFFDQEELEAASAHQIELAISRPEQLDLLDRVRLTHPVSCWLKINTGMNRLGFLPEQAVAAMRRLSAAPAVQGRVRLMSHFANASDIEDTTTDRQLRSFTAVAEALGAGERSLANSAGILGWPDSHFEWVRPGIMLYGSSPFDEGIAKQDGLLPVMTLRSQLIAVNHCSAGDAVGYSGCWRCPEAMPVGVVAIGYGDGYPRHAASGTPVLLNGQRVSLIARVSMDMITIDLRSQPGARVGDPVILWGIGLPAEQVAAAAGTISYQLFCGITSRVQFLERDVEDTDG